MNKFCKQECKCKICLNGGHISYWYAVFCEECLIEPKEIPFSTEKRTKLEFRKQMLDKIKKDVKDFEKLQKDLEDEEKFR